MSNTFQIVYDTTFPINNTFQIPISGRRKFQLVGLSTSFSPQPTILVMQLQSPQLVMQYGNVNGGPYIIIPNDYNHPSFKSKYTFEADFNGSFYLNIIDKDTGTTPIDLGLCILTFQLID